MFENTHSILNRISQIIVEKKGFNLLALDVQGLSTLTDYFLIAEGHVDRHVKSIADAVIMELRKEGIRPLAIEGETDASWIVIDFGDCMVHIFAPGLRERYRLENVWQSGKLVELDLPVAAAPDLWH